MISCRKTTTILGKLTMNGRYGEFTFVLTSCRANQKAEELSSSGKPSKVKLKWVGLRFWSLNTLYTPNNDLLAFQENGESLFVCVNRSIKSSKVYNHFWCVRTFITIIENQFMRSAQYNLFHFGLLFLVLPVEVTHTVDRITDDTP